MFYLYLFYVTISLRSNYVKTIKSVQDDVFRETRNHKTVATRKKELIVILLYTLRFIVKVFEKFETTFLRETKCKQRIWFSGSDALINEQPYRYLTADLMKNLRDDSLPIDVTRDDPVYRQGKKCISFLFSNITNNFVF